MNYQNSFQELSSGSSGPVRGRLRWPSFLWLIFTGRGGGMTPRPLDPLLGTSHEHEFYCLFYHSRRKVQKLRDQSQYISKNVRALQYWRWACGTCCKQYHMLFYIQMAVVSTAILFLFSPSLSFFLEIKVQIYIYFHNKCQYINQFPPKP